MHSKTLLIEWLTVCYITIFISKYSPILPICINNQGIAGKAGVLSNKTSSFPLKVHYKSTFFSLSIRETDPRFQFQNKNKYYKGWEHFFCQVVLADSQRMFVDENLVFINRLHCKHPYTVYKNCNVLIQMYRIYSHLHYSYRLHNRKT